MIVDDTNIWICSRDDVGWKKCTVSEILDKLNKIHGSWLVEVWTEWSYIDVAGSVYFDVARPNEPDSNQINKYVVAWVGISSM